MIRDSASGILKDFNSESEEVSTLLGLGPGLLAASVEYVTISGKRVVHTSDKEELLKREEGALSVKLSEYLLSQLTPASQLYMLEQTTFPVFAHLDIPRDIASLLEFTRVIDTKDPVSMDELKFPTIKEWKTIFDMLRPLCVAVCVNGHGLSFDTLCEFMRDDGWGQDDCCELSKVKCPVCRTRSPIHSIIPTLCSVFVSFAEEEAEKAAETPPKNDKIRTYFSTFSEEDEDD
jgi:hypothetical protein